MFFSLEVVVLIGGGVGVGLQSLLELLEIILRHAHLSLHQQNVLDESICRYSFTRDDGKILEHNESAWGLRLHELHDLIMFFHNFVHSLHSSTIDFHSKCCINFYKCISTKFQTSPNSLLAKFNMMNSCIMMKDLVASTDIKHGLDLWSGGPDHSPTCMCWPVYLLSAAPTLDSIWKANGNWLRTWYIKTHAQDRKIILCERIFQCIHLTLQFVDELLQSVDLRAPVLVRIYGNAWDATHTSTQYTTPLIISRVILHN